MSTSAGALGLPILLQTGQVDLGRQRLITPEGAVSLTTRETELLAYLVERSGQAVPREDLLVDVWNYRATNPTRAVDLAVKRLRAKIEPDPSNPVHVLSVHGVGYRFVPIANPELTPMPPSPARRDRERHTNLAPDRTSFVGRGEELARLRALHDDGTRFITVLGTAGTGKTRLARRHALALADELPGGAWFVDLVEARNLDDVLAAVVEAVGLPAAADADIHTVGAATAERLGEGGLLVLDNFEQVVGVAAADISSWLDRIPALRIVVTSRERLHVRGEVILELAPLPRDEAVELLLTRAAAVRRHGRAGDFTEEELQVLREVVQKLDGIPLAIELAASRLGTLSPSQLAQRLDKRFRLLGDRRSDRPARHATLQAAFDWSWDLLTGEEQEALAVLSVFDGGFGLEAAEEILEEDDPDAPWPADLVQSLRDKSFVVLDEAPGADLRCRLLESVRAYAARKLDETGRTEEVRRRHAAYYLREGEALVAGLQTGTGIERLADLARERANLLGVAERAPEGEDRVRASLVLAPLLLARGPHTTLHQVLDRAIADARGLDRSDRSLGRLLVNRATLGIEAGSFSQAERDAAEAMRVAPLHMDVRARALSAQASVWNQLGRRGEALNAIREAVELTTRAGDRQLEGRIRHTLARILEEQDCVEEADVEYERSLRITRRSGDRWTEAALLSSYAGFLLTKRHEVAQAMAMVSDAERLLQRIGDARRTTRLLVNFADGLARLGRQPEAFPVLERALALARQTGDRGREARVRFAEGWCRLDHGELEVAEQVLVEGARLARAINHRGLEAMADRLRGLVRLEQGRRVEARALFEEAAEVLVESGYPGEAAAAVHGLALLHLTEGRAEDAAEAVERALSLRAPTWLLRQGEGIRAVAEALEGDGEAALARVGRVSAQIDPMDTREVDLLPVWRLTIEVLGAGNAADEELVDRVNACLAMPAVAMEGRVARAFLRQVLTDGAPEPE